MYKQNLSKATSDIWNGLNNWDLWGLVGWHDLKQRYRRSVLGPFWITLSTGITVSGLGYIYSQIFSVDSNTYIPYLTMGYIVWMFLSSLVLDGSKVFINSAPTMKQLYLPYSIHVLVMLWKNIIVFAHNMFIYLVLLVIFDIHIDYSLLLAIPAVFIILLFGFSSGIVLGILCLRFRDLPPIISSVMQLLFFITPVIWSKDAMNARTSIMDYNPFYHMLNILREPLIGGETEIVNWFVSIGISIVMLLTGIAMFALYRKKLTYWV